MNGWYANKTAANAPWILTHPCRRSGDYKWEKTDNITEGLLAMRKILHSDMPGKLKEMQKTVCTEAAKYTCFR